MKNFGLVLSALLLPLRGLPYPQHLEINPRWRGQLAYTAQYPFVVREWRVYTVSLIQETGQILRRLADTGYVFA